MRRMVMAVGGAALVAGLMTGCSSDDESSSPSGSSSSSDVTSAETATEVGAAYCDAIGDLAQTDSDSDPATVREALDQAAENAPEAQADDYRQVAEAYDRYADAIEDRLGDLPDVPGVDVQEFVDSNRDTLDDLSEQFLESTDSLREQLVAQGRQDCNLD